MIDNRLLALLGVLIEMPKFYLTELSILLNRERKGIEKDIQEINHYLQKNDFPLISIKDNLYIVPEILIKEFNAPEKKLKHTQIYLNEIERMQLIYLVTFIRKSELSNFHYQEFLQVSKNTVLTDIRKLREDCRTFDLIFSYSRKKGYFIQGSEINKRKMAFDIITALLESSNGKWILKYLMSYWNEESDVKKLVEKMKEEATQYSISLVEDRLTEIAYMIILIKIRNKKIEENMEKYTDNISQTSTIFQYCKSILTSIINKVNKEEVYFLSSFLLSIAEGNSCTKENSKLYSVTENVVNTMEALSLVSFPAKETLIKSLYIHLVPAYYRLIFGWNFKNILTNQIKEDNQELFDIVSRALDQLRKITGSEISEDEIAYFVIHFGGQIESQLNCRKQYRAMIVCPNGISSSLILKSELQQLFPEFIFLQKHSVADFKKATEQEYDMVFSTVYIDTKKPIYIVQPIIDSLAKNRIIQKVSKDFIIGNYRIPNVDDLLKIIKRNASIHNEKKLYKELFSCLMSQENKQKEQLPMLEDLLTEEYIQIQTNEKIDNWKQAISLACQPLIDHGNIENHYIEAIFSKLEEYGPFIDLGQGVAIPHARPEDGVNHLGMSFLKLEKPINLLNDENHQVQLFITLAAIDNETHLKALSRLTKILSDKKQLKQLKEATNAKEIIELIKEKGEE